MSDHSSHFLSEDPVIGKKKIQNNRWPYTEPQPMDRFKRSVYNPTS